MKEVATNLAIFLFFGGLWFHYEIVSTDYFNGGGAGASSQAEAGDSKSPLVNLFAKNDYVVYPEPLVVDDSQFLQFINT